MIKRLLILACLMVAVTDPMILDPSRKVITNSKDQQDEYRDANITAGFNRIGRQNAKIVEKYDGRGQ